MKNKNKNKKIVSIIGAGSILITSLPLSVFAIGGEKDKHCGFNEIEEEIEEKRKRSYSDYIGNAENTGYNEEKQEIIGMEEEKETKEIEKKKEIKKEKTKKRKYGLLKDGDLQQEKSDRRVPMVGFSYLRDNNN